MTELDERALARGEVKLGLEPNTYSSALFLASIDRAGYRVMRSKTQVVGGVGTETLLGLLGETSFTSSGPGRTRALIQRPGALISVSVGHNVADVTAAGDDAASLDRAIEEILARLPEKESPEVRTPVSFWSELNGTGFHVHRGLEPRPWEDIADGYASSVRGQLGPLLARDSVPNGGRLILWHGEPGTGKTNALRALAHAWRGWCSVNFITDPDRFIGEGMSYLLSVVTEDGQELSPREQKLLVLEDAGELLSADARMQSGQGLSRLLNLSDGLLGLGMNTITLITTNEPLGRLHPAVHRPGRCLAEIEFTVLDVDEASEWFERRGSSEIVTEPKTLAQLYAILEGRDQGAPRRKVGFA